MTPVIEFKNFSFAYPGNINSSEKLILNNINLKID